MGKYDDAVHRGQSAGRSERESRAHIGGPMSTAVGGLAGEMAAEGRHVAEALRKAGRPVKELGWGDGLFLAKRVKGWNLEVTERDLDGYCESWTLRKDGKWLNGLSPTTLEPRQALGDDLDRWLNEDKTALRPGTRIATNFRGLVVVDGKLMYGNGTLEDKLAEIVQSHTRST